MDTKNNHLVIEQLSKTLNRFKPVTAIQPPQSGWIRAIREALGMSGSDLANRMKVSQPRISQLEKDEVAGVATLNTIRKAAEAMDCTLVYALVPRASLSETIRNRARLVVQKRMSRTSHNMMLEEQELPEPEKKRMFENMVDDLVSHMKGLWKDQ